MRRAPFQWTSRDRAAARPWAIDDPRRFLNTSPVAAIDVASATARARRRRPGTRPRSHDARTIQAAPAATPRRRTHARLALAALAPGAALASGPEQFGPFEDTYSFIGFECDGFDILIDGTATTSVTVWFDANGDVDRLLQRTRAPHDTLTNRILH